MFLPSKAQSTTEYAILMGIVLAAFLSMQLYIQRAVQAVIRASTDEFGTQNAVYSSNAEFSSYNSETQSGSLSQGGYHPGGVSTRGYSADSFTTTNYLSESLVE